MAGVPDRSWLTSPMRVEEIPTMLICLCHCVHSLVRPCAARRTRGLVRLTRPATHPLVIDTTADRARSTRAVLAEHALLRPQLLVLGRQVSQPTVWPIERVRLVLRAALPSGWQQTLLRVQPETLLPWHRQGLRLVWTSRSGRAPRTPRIPDDTLSLIRQRAAEHPLWGAERIRGE